MRWLVAATGAALSSATCSVGDRRASGSAPSAPATCSGIRTHRRRHAVSGQRRSMPLRRERSADRRRRGRDRRPRRVLAGCVDRGRRGGRDGRDRARSGRAWARARCSPRARARPSAARSAPRMLAAGRARAVAKKPLVAARRERWSADGAPPSTSSTAGRYLTTQRRHRRELTVEAAMLIGGEWRQAAASEEIEVVNPATEEVVGQRPGGAPADVELAVGHRQARPSRSGRRPTSRSARAHPVEGRGPDRRARQGARGHPDLRAGQADRRGERRGHPPRPRRALLRRGGDQGARRLSGAAVCASAPPTAW